MNRITVAIRNGLLLVGVVVLVPAASYGVAAAAYALTRAEAVELDRRVACDEGQPHDTACD